MNRDYRFGEGKDSFDDVLEATNAYFEENLSKEKIAERMNNLIAYEKHKILKWAPLELKEPLYQDGSEACRAGSDSSIVQYECGEDAAGICKIY